VILIISLNLRRQLSHVASLLFCDCALPVALHLIPIVKLLYFSLALKLFCLSGVGLGVLVKTVLNGLYITAVVIIVIIMINVNVKKMIICP